MLRIEKLKLKKKHRKKLKENQKEDIEDKMAKGFSIKIEGLPQAGKYVNKKLDLAIEKASEGIKDATIFLQGEVKQSIAGHRAEHVSVDTGRFLNSVMFDIKKLIGLVGTNLNYAQFLEFGTSRMQPRAHFRNSMARNKAKIIDDIRKKVAEI